ncbi:MAG TPA: endonuclease MutS2 [Bacteroidales bacterium]|nr:endonuclease MutS2 [Bacteroidales bacterium]HOR81889.1 endonuclease MutS2 [Bacteroidales bacterium]HPJ91685.1 endonuclease MutS2 [Bacteroidales bacterium]
MIYPANFEKKIDFHQIRFFLKENCISTLGKDKVDDIEFQTDIHLITALQEITEEFRQILLFEPSFPTQDYLDIRQALSHLEIEGTAIDIETLGNLRAVLKTIQDCLVFFRVKKEEEKYPFLQQLGENIIVDNALIQNINAIIDSKGNIKDNASSELQTIRQKIKAKETEIQKQLHKIISQAKKEDIIESDTSFTVREGRLVIPIPAAHKRRMKGFIHDASATGQTFFIEPQEVFEANNYLRDLLSMEKKEILRILKNFTDLLRPDISSIKEALNYLGQLDFIRAKAKFALTINAVKPIINNQSIINWKKAKHPILYLNFQHQQKKVIPLDIAIDNQNRILIISGPNAGGKSVCLKTVGLLQYMFQCGLLVPVSELSEFGIFHNLFIDIGDEQSIENDLSTYSSHLKNMDTILKHADDRSLFLMDELGSGTDPQYGGAIAEAFLETLSKKKTLGVITTHFGNLKTIATTTEGLQNAAMLFDDETMSPLFILKSGKWGSSFTFEIAKKIGFSQQLLDEAIKKIGTNQIDYELLLHQLEQEKVVIDNQKRMIDAVDNQLKELIDKYETLNDTLREQKNEIVKNAKIEAKKIIDNANKIIEKTVKEIKEHKADKEVVKQLKEEIKKVEKTIQLPTTLPALPTSIKKQKKENTTIKLSDYVIIKDTNTVGQITAIDNENIVVTFNSINFKTTIDKVVKTNNIPKTQQQHPTTINNQNIYSEIHHKLIHFTTELDIRGLRVDEATEKLERYIDDAILLHLREVSIIHGKGNGVLRSITRNLLSKNKQVINFHDDDPLLGGSGKTIVQLKN